MESEMSTYSSNFAWKIPWTEEPGEATVHGVAMNYTCICVYVHTQTRPTVCGPMNMYIPSFKKSFLSRILLLLLIAKIYFET